MCSAWVVPNHGEIEDAAEALGRLYAVLCSVFPSCLSSCFVLTFISRSIPLLTFVCLA